MHYHSLSDIWKLLHDTFTVMFEEYSFLCTAEVIKYTEKNGHAYIDCIEYTDAGEVKAQCTVCVFKPKRSQLTTFFTHT
jgi:hypothetical protein